MRLVNWRPLLIVSSKRYWTQITLNNHSKCNKRAESSSIRCSEISKPTGASVTLASGKRGNTEQLRTSNYKRNVTNVSHVRAINSVQHAMAMQKLCNYFLVTFTVPISTSEFGHEHRNFVHSNFRMVTSLSFRVGSHVWVLLWRTDRVESHVPMVNSEQECTVPS